MEVEVKIRLPDEHAYSVVRELLTAGHNASYAQENYFFDGTNKELSSQRVVLRLRFFNNTERAVITVKGKTVLQDGISRATEVEEDVDPVTSRSFLQEASSLLAVNSPVIDGLKKTTNVTGLVCIGGFRNQREVFNWEGHTIELDKTSYDWGTVYEIECETDKPEELRDRLEKFLSGNGIQYKYSSKSKFANFVNKTLD